MNWSHITGYRPGPERKSAVCFQSGLRFLMLTGEQEAQLAAVLEILKAAPKG